MNEFDIRADYDSDSVVVYQAYSPAIAGPALAAQCFVPPFSLSRMTWIKPSFLWMMHRSGWATKPGQEHVLAVRISRSGWEEAISQAVLSSADPRVYRSHEHWREAFDRAAVRVQWDPERSLQGDELEYRSIQVGLSRRIVPRYVNDWTVEIRNVTAVAHRVTTHLRDGDINRARSLLPEERLYPLDGSQVGGSFTSTERP